MRYLELRFRDNVITPWSQGELNTIINNAIVTTNGVPFICIACNKTYVYIHDENEQPVIDDRIHVRCKFCRVTNDCLLIDERTEATITESEPFGGEVFCHTERKTARYLVPTEIQKTQLPDDFLLASVNDQALQALREIFDESQLVRDRSPRACCVLLRVAMEGLVEYILDQKEIVYDRDESLGSKIKRLDDYFPLGQWGNEVWKKLKQLGNEAAHWREKLEGEIPDKADTLTKGFQLLIDQYILQDFRQKSIANSHPPHSPAE